MLHLSEFVWTLRSSVLVVFNNFLLIDATERRKIRSDQKRFFIALSLYPFHFSRTLPLIKKNYENFPFLFFLGVQCSYLPCGLQQNILRQ